MPFFSPLSSRRRLHAPEARQGPRDLGVGEAEAADERDRAEGVAHVVEPGQRRGETGRGKARLEERELGPLRPERDVAGREVGAGVVERDANDRRARFLRDVDDARIVGVHDDGAVFGDEADDLSEGLDHRRKIGVEVGVVELDVADEEVPGLVVEELGPAVEERRVVLVALEDEVRAAPAPVAPAEVLHLPADDEARVSPGVEQEPGGQGRGRRLAVRPGDDDRGLPGQQMFPDRLWQGEDRQAAAGRLGRLDVVAESGVADDDHVAVGGDVARCEALRDGDAEPLEGRRHGRVEGPVAPGDAVALLQQQGGQRDHGRPADRDEVKAADFRHLRRGVWSN